MKRTLAEEKATCIQVARIVIGDGNFTVEQLARLLFEQRQAARYYHDAVEEGLADFDEIEVKS